MAMQDFLTALALVMVIEGVWPFLNPESLRRTMITVARQNDRTLRSLGFVSMVCGVALLYFVN